jgi:hypothetical protein
VETFVGVHRQCSKAMTLRDYRGSRKSK